MALFKILRGNETALPKNKTDGYAYFCTDTGSFFIDYTDGEVDLSGNLVIKRSKISAEYSDKLRYVENGEMVEIDACKVVFQDKPLPYFVLQDEITGELHKLHISNGVLMLDNKPINGGSDEDDSNVTFDEETGSLIITEVTFNEQTGDLVIPNASFDEITGNLTI